MNIEEIVKKVRTAAEKIDISGHDFLAVQVNLSDVEDGVLYVEIKDGKLSVEPYEYHDRNCAITLSATNFSKLIDGKLDPVLAFTTGKLKVDGDINKALEFSKLLK